MKTQPGLPPDSKRNYKQLLIESETKKQKPYMELRSLVPENDLEKEMEEIERLRNQAKMGQKY